MVAPSMRSQELDVVYSLLRAAAAQKQPVTAVYDGLPRAVMPTLAGEEHARRVASILLSVWRREGKRPPDVAGGCGRLALYRRG